MTTDQRIAALEVKCRCLQELNVSLAERLGAASHVLGAVAERNAAARLRQRLLAVCEAAEPLARAADLFEWSVPSRVLTGLGQATVGDLRRLRDAVAEAKGMPR